MSHSVYPAKTQYGPAGPTGPKGDVGPMGLTPTKVPIVGEIAFNSNVIVTAISTINTWTKVNIASFLTTSLLFDSPSNFTLRYIGTAGGTGFVNVRFP